MATSVSTRPLTRDKLAQFLKSHELIKAFENLTADVSAALPEAIDAIVLDIDGLTVLITTAQAAANAAQDDANALEIVPFVTIGASPTTSNERSLAVAASLKLTDGGAGNAVTLAIADLEAVVAPALLNSWVNFGAPFNPAGYYKDQLGIVHLRGLVKNGVIGSAIFTLPAGYRPTNQEIFAVTSNSAFGRLDVTTAGDVVLGTGSNLFVSLDSITFRAA